MRIFVELDSKFRRKSKKEIRRIWDKNLPKWIRAKRTIASDFIATHPMRSGWFASNLIGASLYSLKFVSACCWLRARRIVGTRRKDEWEQSTAFERRLWSSRAGEGRGYCCCFCPRGFSHEITEDATTETAIGTVGFDLGGLTLFYPSL